MQRLMRRLRGGSKDRSERGAAAVLVVILSFVLVGMASFAVDAGLMVSTKAQLQNGADASALALAQYCAKNAPSTCSSTYDATLAPKYTKDNSLDGSAQVQGVTWPASGQVTVATTTPPAGLRLILGGVFGTPTVQMTATATAAWGGPSTGPATIPLALAPCQFDLTGTVQTILTHGSQQCAGDASQSGQVIPGGFEWVQGDTVNGATVCQATVLKDSSGRSYLQGTTGTSASKACGNQGDLSSHLNSVILLPVWSSTNGLTGANAIYYIEGFAAFYLTGYNFPGAKPGSAGDTTGLSGSNNGIRGYFVRFVADPSEYQGGGYTGGGASLPPSLIK